MGDKGGKKNKDKQQKQHEEKVKQEANRNRISSPYGNRIPE